MTREEIINALRTHAGSDLDCGDCFMIDCEFSDVEECCKALLLAAASMLEDDAVDDANKSEIPTSCEVLTNSIRPSHYKTGAVECIDALRACMDINEFAGFLKGNIIKYLWRYEKKGGVEDLKKARVYLDWLIEV